MQDIIQQFANRFCAEFGLAPVRIEFAVGFTKQSLRLYNFLLKPKSVFVSTEQRWDAKLTELAKQGEHDAMKDYLWSEAANSKLKSYASEIEARDIAILRAAVYLCKNKEVGERILAKLDKDGVKTAEETADRIRKFHAEGKAIKEIEDLLDLATKERGKMPLVVFSSGDLEKYIHEAIHYILQRNYDNRGHRLFIPLRSYQPFNEGFCSFLHIRFRGKFKTYGMYYPPFGNANYLRWSRYFFAKFAGLPNKEVMRRLRTNLSGYAWDFMQWLRTGRG
jgi:hypothetical protein